ncbi:MAG: LarC family nickel insertion protein [Erysipelotrichaceae bacterium]|nr:LarC family nickel insertion protein [Erysipelotrichaceae bacterium]
MKILYFDCNRGISGDMIVSSLLELFDEDLIKELNNIQIATFNKEKVNKYNQSGTRLIIQAVDNHGHRHLDEVFKIINNLNINEKVKEDAKNIYKIIANAESNVHNETVYNVHFHEVGSIKAIANVIASAYLINKLNVDNIFASKINIGKGKVECAHGLLDIPTPATKEILKDIPYFCNDIEGELATPTAVAILKYYVDEFKDNINMKLFKKGVGIGNKDFKKTTHLETYLYE